MKIAGIICEYNPFHLGHQYQLNWIRQQLGSDAAIVCVMSGNYVQRGLPAMWDKYTRARAAIAAGADVVLELPLTKVLQSAEGFAQGGVEILDRFGVDNLCFGAECGNGDTLMNLARRWEDPTVTAALKEYLAQGLPYASARQMAVGDDTGVLREPNNILGLEYCRALLARGSKIQPLVIRRRGDYHSEIPDPQTPSAAAVRARYPHPDWQQLVPPAAAALLRQTPVYDIRWGERAVLARLRGLSDTQWSQCAHGSEGLWRKAMKAARSQADYEAILQAVKSKRYPRTRIQRLILCAYLGITQQELSSPIQEVRILAVSSQGRPLLRAARDRSDLALLNPGQRRTDADDARLEIQASDLFTLFSSPSAPTPCCLEQSARLF